LQLGNNPDWARQFSSQTPKNKKQQHRQSTDARSFDGLFYVLCDEVGTLDWESRKKKLSTLIQRQLQRWIAALPNYIKACLPISCCES
jgi:hypothetical protein